MTADFPVLVTGEVPEHLRSALVPVDPTLSSIVAAVDAHRDELVVVVVTGDDAEVDRLTRLVRAAVTTESVVVVPVPGPRSRAVLLAHLLATQTDRESAGVLLAALPELSERVRVRADLGSVAGLRSPSPSLGQHAASWLPGRRFTTDLTTVRSGAPAQGTPRAEGTAAVVLAAGDDVSRRWADELAAALGGDTVPLAQPDAGTWGAKKWVEAAWWDRSMDAVVGDVLDGLSFSTCGWCERVVVRGRTCAFCGSLEHEDPGTEGEAA